MTFDLLKLGQIILHFRKISPGMFRNLGKEIMIHCPFCNDAMRQNSSDHGHLYFSIDFPVFNCFRCNTSGTLIKFLILTDFVDEDVFNYLKQFIHHNFTKDIQIRKYDYNLNKIKKKIIAYLTKFIKDNKKEFNIFKNYLYERIGEFVFADFLVVPKIEENNISCCFYNSEGIMITKRFIKDNKKRYQKKSGRYFFQNKDFSKYKNIVIAEGPFDIITLYLFNLKFDNSLFFALCGKNYLNFLEESILNDMIIGEYNINLIFDNDYNYINTYNKCKILTRNLNKDITLNGFVPSINNFNDVTKSILVTKIE